MRNIYKKLGTIALALLIGASVFSLFPTVTKAETTNVTWTNGSLVTSLDGSGTRDRATVGKTNGKWYWEIKVTNVASFVGITGESDQQTQTIYGNNGSIYNSVKSPVIIGYSSGFGTGDVIGIALDLDNDKIVWYKNGVSLGANSIKPSELEGTHIFPVIASGTGTKINFEANFGASNFKYPVPDGFLPYQESGTSTTPDPTTKPDPSTTPDPSDTDGSSQPTGDRAILTVTMDNGFDKEFDLSKKELNAFIAWYDAKDAGRGASFFAIDKHNNNKGPFSNRKDYVIFNKILTFEVSEYSSK
ncbi:SPRY domain-containing protein [Paenibacillus jamilae]|uniref:SPRY domain-containing protein n=1 Tax=Paenibacillus jamilae TaxID=114136 RepID=UPI003D292E48